VSREQNREYLRSLRRRSLWVSLPIIALSLWYIASQLGDGLRFLDHKDALVFLGMLALMAGFVWWMMQRMARKMARALRSPTPDELLQSIERSFKMARIPDKEAFVAGTRAVALSLYGEGDRAREALAGVDWHRLAPLVQAQSYAAQSLIALLCDGDFAQGLRDAERARSLAGVDAGTVGAKASDRFYGTVVALAQVFADDKVATTLPTLEASTKAMLFPTLRAIAMAGLAVDAHQSGDSDRFRARRSQLAAFAPQLEALLFGRSEPPPVA